MPKSELRNKNKEASSSSRNHHSSSPNQTHALSAMRSADGSGYRDWTTLPPELLGSIAERLPVPDYLRFPAVAKAFAAAVAGNLYLPSGPQSPWLMLPTSDGDAEGVFSFLEVSTLKTYRIPVPDLRGRRVIGCNDGWLVTVEDKTEVRLLNPLTRSQIALPSLATITQAFYALTLNHYDLGCLTNKVLIWRTSAGKEGKFAAVAMTSGVCFAFAQEGDEQWTYLDESSTYYNDVVYDGERFYCVYRDSSLYSFDICADGSRKKELVCTNLGQSRWLDTYLMHLVVIDGELFQVWVDRGEDWEGDFTWAPAIKLFKFDPEKHLWHDVEDLGDHALFLGTNSLSISTSHVRGIKKNHIYFVDDCDSMFSLNHLSCYSLGDGRFESFYAEASQRNWERTIWFMPNLS